LRYGVPEPFAAPAMPATARRGVAFHASDGSTQHAFAVGHDRRIHVRRQLDVRLARAHLEQGSRLDGSPQPT
jgi:hypothetical protein